MPRKIPGDWHEGGFPDNAVVDEAAYIETAQVFDEYRSRREVGLEIGAGAGVYTGNILDVGERGVVRIGACTMLTGALLICDELIEIGSHCLISWSVIIMDTYRTRLDPESRRRALRAAASHPQRRVAEDVPARPVRIGNNVWIGFDACVLPGVRIGDGSVIGCRSTVAEDIPAYVVAAGSPARVVRHLEPGRDAHG